MPNIETASNFLDTRNKAHSNVKFTMETECNEMLPFLGIQLLNRSPQIDTKVYIKPTNSGLLLHYQSHIDNRYKKGSRDGAVVRALASHRCGPGSIPGPGVTCGLSLLLVLVLAPRGFFRVLRFSSVHKNQHF